MFCLLKQQFALPTARETAACRLYINASANSYAFQGIAVMVDNVKALFPGFTPGPIHIEALSDFPFVK